MGGVNKSAKKTKEFMVKKFKECHRFFRTKWRVRATKNRNDRCSNAAVGDFLQRLN